MRVVGLATAAGLLVLGLIAVVWAAYAYWVAAEGGAGDLTAAGWVVFATVGMLVGIGFIYVAWRFWGRASGE